MPNDLPTNILDRIKDWPTERREEAERLLESMELAGTAIYRLSPHERALVIEGLEQAKRGEFATEDELEAFWKRHDE